MFSRVRIAIRFFFVGLAVGILLAPRSGDQTRQMLREKADRLLNEVLDAATLGTAQGTGTSSSSAGTGGTATVADETAGRGTGRSNGGTRTSRSRAASSGTGAGAGSSSSS